MDVRHHLLLCAALWWSINAEDSPCSQCWDCSGCNDNNTCNCSLTGDPVLGLNICKPYISNMLFDYGPVSGGTLFALYGGYIIGTNSTVSAQLRISSESSLDYIDLKILYVNETKVGLVTPDMRSYNDVIDQSSPVYLRLHEAQLDIVTNQTFTIKADPVIEKIEPLHSIIRGGIMQTITGQNLDSVFPWFLNITIVFAYHLHYKQSSQVCSVKNSTVMHCPAPALTHCPSHTGGCKPATPRKRRDVSERHYFSQNRPDFQYYVVVLSNGGPDFRNVSNMLPDYGIIHIYDTPKIDHFPGSDRMQCFEPNGRQDYIDLKGNHLNLGPTEEDYEITIGQDGVCHISQLYTTSIHCIPTKERPALGPTAKRGAPSIKIKVGFLTVSPGYVKYGCNSQPCDDPETCEIIIGSSVGAILAVILIIVVVLVVRWIRRTPALPPDKELRPVHLMDVLSDENLQTDVRKHLLPVDNVKPWPLSREIGKGQFGLVFQGNCVDKSGNYQPVAVKSLKGAHHLASVHSEEYMKRAEEFLAEAMIMTRFKHKNILPLVGVLIDENKPYVILPYMENSDMRKFLMNPSNTFTVRDLIEFGIQVGVGMEYLSKERLVHRDLAARNCMVSKEMVVKIADFGLARDIYESDYYRVADRTRPLPVKWMAPESLENSRFSTASDAWSYGVLLWELMTRGKKPYADIDSSRIKEYIQLGRRLEQPPAAPDELYALMMACWEHLEDRRPSFSKLVTDLRELVGEEPLTEIGPEHLRIQMDANRRNRMYENLSRYVDHRSDVHRYTRLGEEGSASGYLDIAEERSRRAEEQHANAGFIPPSEADSQQEEEPPQRGHYQNVASQAEQRNGAPVGGGYMNMNAMDTEGISAPEVRATTGNNTSAAVVIPVERRPAPALAPRPDLKPKPQAIPIRADTDDYLSVTE